MHWIILKPDSIFLILWQITSIFAMIYYLLIVPYMIIFDTYTDFFLNFEFFLDGYFILDIIINFLTTYRDERGYYVYSLS
jgi:hypothetical protein